MRSPIAFLSLTLLFAACGGSSPATDAGSDAPRSTDVTTDASADARVGMECDPIGSGAACMQPRPSAYYQGSTHQLPMAALPASAGRLSNGGNPVPLDPTAWNRVDGFSPSAPLLVYFPERIDPAS